MNFVLGQKCLKLEFRRKKQYHRMGVLTGGMQKLPIEGGSDEWSLSIKFSENRWLANGSVCGQLHKEESFHGSMFLLIPMPTIVLNIEAHRPIAYEKLCSYKSPKIETEL